jgi:hypothetical protein
VTGREVSDKKADRPEKIKRRRKDRQEKGSDRTNKQTVLY